ncbi:MAG TPA: restriction endonuclease [Verrucomicrobiales bacterium]|nr:restriction endonuclease [Verrucomicrobiales bacterium]
MATFQTRKYGRTEHPALIALTVGTLTWLALSMAGGDLTGNNRDISSRTSVALLAVLKSAREWVAMGMGLLVFIWAWQRRREEAQSAGEQAFMEWSAELPQWRPQEVQGEASVFVVPASRATAAEQSPPASAAFAAGRPAKGLHPAPVPSPVVAAAPAAEALPVIRLRPLREMARQFSTLSVPAPKPEPTRTSPVPLAAPVMELVRATPLALPQHLPLAALKQVPQHEFEHLTGEYFRKQGYDVAALGDGTGTGSADLLLHRKNEVIVVKCLPGAQSSIPMEDVRELLALVVGEGATRGIVITSGSFSRRALKFAHRKAGGRVQLINGRQFESMLRTAAAAGASPACPCCRGPMQLSRKKSRRSLSWVCERTPVCPGVIRSSAISRPDRQLAA